MGEPSKLIVSHDLKEFFRAEVMTARDELRVKMNEQTEYYLVNLLCDFSRGEQGSTPQDEPLAFMYKKAAESTAAEQMQRFKHLGDVALYMAGFFTDSIERSLVDVDYYICMGGTAYHSLAGLVGAQRHGTQFAQLYGQLAGDFTVLVDVLNQVAERATANNHRDIDLLKLYDRYARTGSRRLRRLLLDRGFLPTEKIPTDYVQ
jgi:hypothetical protein